MRKPLDRKGLLQLFKEISATAPRKGHFRIYLTGGATAVERGWRESTLDADLSANRDGAFAEIQRIKEKLNLNVEFAKPTDFVPALAGEAERHLFVECIGNVDFLHFDPYAQAFSKIVRGFERDVEDVKHMVDEGWVELPRLAELVKAIPDAEFARYPSISKKGVLNAVDHFRSSEKRKPR